MGCYSRINFGKEGGIPSGESAKYFGGVKKNALARKMVGIAKGRTSQLASLNYSLLHGGGNVVVLREPVKMYVEAVLYFIKFLTRYDLEHVQIFIHGEKAGVRARALTLNSRRADACDLAATSSSSSRAFFDRSIGLRKNIFTLDIKSL